MLVPVILPPGRTKFDTRPTATGSAVKPTIGIVVVAALTSSTMGLEIATIISVAVNYFAGKFGVVKGQLS